MNCPKCGFDNADGNNFCANCAERLLHTCPVCGSTGQSTSSYCTVCGHVLKESLAAAGLARKPSNVPPGNDLAIITHFLTPQFAENISKTLDSLEK